MDQDGDGRVDLATWIRVVEMVRPDLKEEQVGWRRMRVRWK
jgi:hypothetical protein